MSAAKAGLALLLCGLALACRTPALVGSSWETRSIDRQALPSGVRSTLVFESEERAVGTAGCNRYFARVELSGESLRFEDAGATRMACQEPAMGQEQRFLAALEAVRSYRLVADELRLLDESGAERLRFTRVADPIL